MSEKDYSFPQRLWGHFKTITTHKITVGKLCFKTGLYYQGFMHDFSKYSPVEFWAGVKYWDGGKHSPIVNEKEHTGYSLGWLHHKGRNRHHWDFWTDTWDGQIVPLEMPKKYVKEMACDRVGACKIYQGKNYTDSSPLNYHINSAESKIMNPKTAALLNKYLTWIKDYGLEEGLKKIKAD